MKPRLSGGGFLLVLLLLNSWRAVAQAPPPPQTDPVEAAAVNAILSKLGLSAPASWNISGNPCSGAATDDTQLDDNPAFNPAIKCDCSDRNNTLCHVTRFKINMLDAVGPIPEELRNLTHLRKLDLRRNYLTGPLPAFIGELTALESMTVGINALSGPIPKELGNLVNLVSLALGSNNFNGTLPDELGKLTKLRQIYIDSNDFSGPLPSTLSQLKNLSILWASDNNFTGQIPDYLGSLTNLTDLKLQGNSFQGPIPKSLSNLVKLSKLVLRNSKISDTLASVDFSKFGNLSLLDLSFNNITGPIPQSILNLPSLSYLDFSYNYLSGNFPSWATKKNLQLNLVANDFVIDSSNNSVLPWGLDCLQHNIPCFLGSPQSASFAVDCGGSTTISGSDNSMYQADNATLGAASYYVAGAPTWGVSSVGLFTNAPNGTYIIYSSRQFDNTLDSSLFQTARMSPSSLRYYGIGLENGNYTVTLQFAEVDFPDIESWRSRGRRVFDIYIQGDRKEQNFDIRMAAGGKSFTVVKKKYVVPVTKNFLEIHLFWAGKGTCCIPYKGYYGPAISALSATPNFVPTVRSSADRKSSSKTGVIVGVVVSVSVFALITLAGIFLWCQKRRKLLLELEELYTIVGRPNVFSYSELRSATENFCSSNLLGKGGYGSVYKGKLSDGRVVAVKQLSQSSNQGKKQFAAEIDTISRVQHRNLVSLYGCCLESNTPLLVYEYLENGSLDHALFEKGGLNLDWPARFEICLGIARGIAYLHEESTIRIVHRDIKASNVLLDSDLNPKISDFGLAKLYDDKKTHVSTRVAGTFGYLAPEYAMRGHMTEKVDVFAFGVVALEIVAGESNYQNTLDEDTTYIFERVWELYENGRPLDFVDPKLTECNGDEVLRVIRAALHCTQGAPHRRPPMSKVVSMLTGDADMTEEVAKPSYITEWQVKAVGSGSFTSSQVGSSSTTTQPSSGVHGGGGVQASPEPGDVTPVLPSPLFTSIIDEGR
uniref:non-specific serine/threonine protein kinase n=1 Tax=Setaria italica TaxID=4555 RepID=K3Y4X1_SETIT